MHKKSFVVDNQVAIVGGRNIGDEYFSARADLDPRSLNLNTEMGVIVSSAEVAEPIFEQILEMMPQKAYRLQLNAIGGVECVDGDDAEVYELEPRVGFLRGVLSLLLTPPLSSQPI